MSSSSNHLLISLRCKMATASILFLVDKIKKETTQGSPSPGHSHAHLLQLVYELQLAVETPTETILRLIYQVRSRCKFNSKRLSLIRCASSLLKMPHFVPSQILLSSHCLWKTPAKEYLQQRSLCAPELRGTWLVRLSVLIFMKHSNQFHSPPHACYDFSRAMC